MAERRVDGQVSYQLAFPQIGSAIGDSTLMLDWADLAFSVNISYVSSYTGVYSTTSPYLDSDHEPPTAESFSQAFSAFLLDDSYDYEDYTGIRHIFRFADSLGTLYVLDVDLRPDPSQNPTHPTSQVFDVVLHTSTAAVAFIRSTLEENKTDVHGVPYNPFTEDLVHFLGSEAGVGEDGEAFLINDHPDYKVSEEGQVQIALNDGPTDRRLSSEPPPSGVPATAIVHGWDPPTDAIKRWVALGAHIDHAEIQLRSARRRLTGGDGGACRTLDEECYECSILSYPPPSPPPRAAAALAAAALAAARAAAAAALAAAAAAQPAATQTTAAAALARAAARAAAALALAAARAAAAPALARAAARAAAALALAAARAAAAAAVAAATRTVAAAALAAAALAVAAAALAAAALPAARRRRPCRRRPCRRRPRRRRRPPRRPRRRRRPCSIPPTPNLCSAVLPSRAKAVSISSGTRLP